MSLNFEMALKLIISYFCVLKIMIDTMIPIQLCTTIRYNHHHYLILLFNALREASKIMEDATTIKLISTSISHISNA